MQMQRAAIIYARRFGWAVFALAARSKTPLRGTRGVYEATRDIEKLTRAWKRQPRANVAIATGRVSGLVVLDIDPRHSGDLELAKLEAQHEKLPDTPEVVTGSGGRHFYFKYPSDPPARWPKQLAPGVDIKADGGYVVAPPSIHPETGQLYEWELSSRPDEVELAELPRWLLDIVREKSREAKAAQVTTEEIPAGARNNTLARIAGGLRRQGLEFEEIRAALLAINEKRCSPPLAAREVERIAKSISRYQPACAPIAPARVAKPTPWALARHLGCSLTAAKAILAQREVVS